MGQLLVSNCIFKGSSNMFLPHHGVKKLGSVFSGRNNKTVHSRKIRNSTFKYVTIKLDVFQTEAFDQIDNAR